MRIAIISLGGKSSKAIATACKRYFDKVDMLSIKDFEIHLTNKGIKVTHEKKNLDKYDCMYIRGSHKYTLLKRAITRYFKGEVYMPHEPGTFTIAHDKFLTLLELQRHGITIPKTFYAASCDLAKEILAKEVKYPVIIKVPEGTHGKGVMIADSLKSSKTILDMLEGLKQPFVIQEFVKTKKTSDIRAIVIGDEVVAYQRQAQKGEVRSNVHQGGMRKPHELKKKQRDLAIRSARAIGAEICGVDILNSSKPSVIEINLSPGIADLKEVTGVNVNTLIAKYLRDQTKEFLTEKERLLSPFKKLVNQLLPKKKEKKNGR